ncbi:MAG: hypothetical protein ABEH47_05010 [Haloferacaceae archaeon]
MTRYEPFDDGVEARGRTLLALDEALSRFSEEYRRVAREATAEYGIEDPDPDAWYPQAAELNALERIARELEPHIVDRVGEQIPDVAEWPAVSNVEEGLRSIDDAYHRNHRGGDIGHYRFEKVDDRTGEVTCRTPYPCPFDRGVVRAVAKKYSPVESLVFVEERGDECRREGDERCTYTVYW